MSPLYPVRMISCQKNGQITVNWLSDDELQIATTTQYENSLPQTDKVLFLAEKQNEIRLEKLNETDNELSLTQETVILSEEDYQVDLIEQLVLELVDGYKLESIGINVYAIDHESDPLENTLDCRNLIKIK